MLEIPSLGRVPRTWTLHHASRIPARVALALMDAGHVSTNIGARSTPAELIRNGLKRWLEKQEGKRRIIHSKLRYADYQSRLGFGPQGPAAIVTLECDQWECIEIGAQIEALERVAPGLGETVLYWLDTATQNRIPIYTPSRAFDLCCWMHWGGGFDETELLEEARMNGEAPEDIEYIKRADWDAQIPTWASMPKEKLKRGAIERLATQKRAGRFVSRSKNSAYAPVYSVARALLALIDTLNNTPIFDMHEEHPVMPMACYLRWSAADHSDQAYDDWANMLSQTGEYQDHIDFFEHCDGEELGPQLCSWLNDRLQPFFAFVRALEELIVLVTPRPKNLMEAFR